MGEQSRGERGSNREKAVEMVRPRGRNGGRGRRQRGSQRSGGCRLRGYGGGKGRVGSGWMDGKTNGWTDGLEKDYQSSLKGN